MAQKTFLTEYYADRQAEIPERERERDGIVECLSARWKSGWVRKT